MHAALLYPVTICAGSSYTQSTAVGTILYELLFPLPSSAVLTIKSNTFISQLSKRSNTLLGKKWGRVKGNQAIIFYIPGVGEYPNVLTSCWGPALADVDFEMGDHSLTVPSAEADSNCWWFPPRYDKLHTASVCPVRVAAKTFGSKMRKLFRIYSLNIRHKQIYTWAASV